MSAASRASKTSRSRIMAAVKSRDTKPERMVSAILRAEKIRYVQNAQNLSGKPDFLLPGARMVIFVHGCWWHGHDCKRGDRKPKTNRTYWINKISGNMRRDRRVARQLRAAGYCVWTVWECRLQGEGLSRRLLNVLRHRLSLFRKKR